ncbi:MAG: hypothetical protein EOO65_05835 [Methanosarcinales archaeon]|nr:MAG: hypothetical protein EOO65_05835 [Methanosarcinales archaeon]
MTGYVASRSSDGSGARHGTPAAAWLVPISHPFVPRPRVQTLDGAIITGEIHPDALAHLESQLVEVYGKHIAERTEWGRIDEEVKGDLMVHLKRTASTIEETRLGLSEGLELRPLPEGFDLDELMKTCMARTKSKKSAADVEQLNVLQGEEGPTHDAERVYLSDCSTLLAEQLRALARVQRVCTVLLCGTRHLQVYLRRGGTRLSARSAS